MRKIISITSVLILILTLSVAFSSCSSNKDEEAPANTTEEVEDIPEEIKGEDYDNGVTFEEEEEEFDVVVSKKSIDQYYGKWEATSGQAVYQYGEVNLNIKKNGTWTGYIADEDLEGTWKETSEGIALTSELFDCDLSFTDSGVLLMRFLPYGDTETINTVLTKK